MDDLKNNKIERFINDTVMSDAVYSVLLDSFLKERPAQDVYVLAGSRLAVDFLNQGWKELEKAKSKREDDGKTGGNVGM